MMDLLQATLTPSQLLQRTLQSGGGDLSRNLDVSDVGLDIILSVYVYENVCFVVETI